MDAERVAQKRRRVNARFCVRSDRSEKQNIVYANPAHDLQEMLENKGFLVQSIIGPTRVYAMKPGSKLLRDASNKGISVQAHQRHRTYHDFT